MGSNVANPADVSAFLQCRVYHSVDQVIANATSTFLAFNSELFDNDSMHSAGSNTRITFNTAGLYLVSTTELWGASALGRRLSRIVLNGVTIIGGYSAGNAGAADNASSGVTVIYRMAVADYVQVSVNQDSGGNLTVFASANESPEFMAVRLGP